MKQWHAVQDAFQTFGFSAQEARVYVALLESGKVNGSELAKRLGLTRASVYGSLNSLVEKGAAWLLPGSPQLFEAVPYRQLLQRLKKTTSDCLAVIEDGLRELPRHSTAEQVINFPDEAQFATELRQALAGARHEIYLSVCAPIDDYQAELTAAAKRGVRVIGFTMNAALAEVAGIEWHTRELRLPPHEFSQRLLAVIDMNHCLTGGCDGRGAFLGIATRNPLLVKLFADHIHHDIYLARMQRKTGVDPVLREFLLKTLYEKNVCHPRREP